MPAEAGGKVRRDGEATGELLLEIRAEEIPARMLEPAVRQLATRVFEELTTRGVGPTVVETAFTPRRLVLALSGFPRREKDREEEHVGPPAGVAWDEEGRPTKALEGFARRLGVDPGELERVQTEKGEYAGTTLRVEGRTTAGILTEILPEILAGLSWAKQMRWSTEAGSQGPWVRPVHGVVALVDGEVLGIELFGVAAGRETVGHPILSPEPFEVEGVSDYFDAMASRGIVARPPERLRALEHGMEERAEEHGGTLVEDPELAAKLTAICEIPGVLEGSFDEAFLELPREVLIESLREHQSAFTVEKEGELLPVFLTVMDRPDDPAGRVRSGNEWVVAARLADARFFRSEDAKRKLAERAAELDRLTFHVELGSYAEKTRRVAELAGYLCRELGLEEAVPAAVEAAGLAKADLATEMVREFTSLQGVVGGIYAREEGYPEEVWQAIYDQYLPAGSHDPIPRGEAGRVVALADRLDTLVGLYGIGRGATGSRDPFGLRRAAQGVVRILLDGALALDLDLAAAWAARLYGERLERSGEEILEALRPFLADRVRFLLGERGYAYDEVEAALQVGWPSLPDVAARVEALHEQRSDPEFLDVVLAAKRIENIVRDAPEHALHEESLVEPAERELHAAYGTLKQEIEAAAAEADYARGLERVARFAPVLDRFFVEVLVMDEDERLRHNRIALLQGIERVLSRIAKLTEMVVDKSEHRSRATAGAGGGESSG